MNPKTCLTLAALATTAIAGSTITCGDCEQATSSDCYAAFALIPTSGTVSGNDNTYWTSGSCTFSFFPQGDAVDVAYIHGYAQSLLNQCCTGSSCSGVGFDTGTTDALSDGCVCMAEEGHSGCQCGAGTPSMECL
ncbi:uncharacterized protein BO72DRAFT_501187 [Aspergillus fijiensis CBS 313.89]|uniref:EGF-like domain-containing protein n=1 Tax=Aspergillus fijiensis CBS 313.89 TaxID=1448319 RepID=A0A8G1VUI8_9EURO|nr:uncharacterized protein BO72DRAFT_501187 [Aspergillus fijiensis CBS 313.89]RAK72183.1 hypothetical protein BO72DRAFT_501187 [Aspergillus fijiensis CBS 313.89]